MINYIKNLIKINIFLTLNFFLLIVNPLMAANHPGFKQVEATGRAILLENDINTSRKRALEDALYIAALRGGANIDGFSAISSNTVINDHSIVKATNRVIDFKILSEEQSKEFLSIKISAVVGDVSAGSNCKKRPLNITLLKGAYYAHSNVPSKLSRYTPIWYKRIYEIISNTPNVIASNQHNKTLEDLKKANVNSTFNYNAITKGMPLIQAGDYSIVPMVYLAAMSGNSNFFNYNVKLDLNIYRGPGFKLVSKKSYYLTTSYIFDTY